MLLVITHVRTQGHTLLERNLGKIPLFVVTQEEEGVLRSAGSMVVIRR